MSESNHNFKHIGHPRKLLEGAEKVTGHAQFTGDFTRPGMLFARPILSPYAHATIRSVDRSAALAAPGVVAVLTAEDLPTYEKLITSRNTAVLAKEKVLFRGQPVAVVVGTSATAAQDAVDLVYIDYDPLPAVTDLASALRDDAPLVWPNGLPAEDSELSAAHANVDRSSADGSALPRNVFAHNHYEWGDVEQGLAEADCVIERTYRVPMVHQGYLEPHACIAEPDPLGRGLTIYTATQGQFMVRSEVARLLSLPVSQVRVVPMTFGGGFGAKYGIVEPLTAAVAVAVGKPIKLVLSRSEDFVTTTPAHAIEITLKTGARRNGAVTALDAQVTIDNGIFAFKVAGIVSTLLGGYYKFPNLRINAHEANTHKLQAAAYRAPGAPQATLAIESNMDEMARALNLDPLSFRLDNAARAGDRMGNGEIWPEIGLIDCLERLREHPAWQGRNALGPDEGVGIAIGGWPAFMGPAAAICNLDEDGTVSLQLGTVDISGVNSTFVLVAAETLGVDPADVMVIQGDTRSGPYGPNSGGSAVTYSTAGAVAEAAKVVKHKLLELAAEEFEADPDDIELVDGTVRVKGVPDRSLSIRELAQEARRRRGGGGPLIGEGHAAMPENAPGFVAHLAHVKVDRATGEVTPLHYVAIQDVGFALNPMMVEGQIHGGAVQGIGMGLYEAMVFDDAGQLLSGSFMDYALPRSDNTPTVEAIMVEHPSPHGPFGARGVGEPPITAGPAALANAIRDAVGVRLTEMPIRSEQVWRALQEG